MIIGGASNFFEWTYWRVVLKWDGTISVQVEGNNRFVGVVEGFIGCIDGTGDGQSLAEVDYYLAYVELTIMVDVV